MKITQQSFGNHGQLYHRRLFDGSSQDSRCRDENGTQHLSGWTLGDESLMCVQYLYVDQRKFANLSTEVFADQVDVDYTHLLGGAPYVTTGQKQATGWEAQMSGYASTQHGIVYVPIPPACRVNNS